MRLLADGESSKSLAACLDLAVTTLEAHRRQVMAKLGLRRVAELTQYASAPGRPRRIEPAAHFARRVCSSSLSAWQASTVVKMPTTLWFCRITAEPSFLSAIVLTT